jgi:peptidoglycan/LPS O-acetylase OafA/YrhL
MFFAMSGFLMPPSYAGAGNFLAFLAKRCRRIFPGMIVCSFVMVYVIGAAFTKSDLLSYLSDREQAGTFLYFAVLHGRLIPTVFSDFLYRDALNGSLWSLPVEFGWYIVIGSALAFSNSWKTAAALFWLSAAAVVVLANTGAQYVFYDIPATFFALFGIAFATGALLSMTRQTWAPYRVPLVVIAILSLVVTRGVERQVLGTASLAFLTIVAGTSFRDILVRGKFDISYGVYIYAFPIQQIVINRVTHHFWLGMALSAALTAVAGAASFYLVERCFLHRYAEKRVAQPSTAAVALAEAT